MTASRTDRDLLGARDATSFELFYLRYVSTLLGFFARRTGDPGMAADLTAETFACALAGRRRPEAEESPRAWLFGLAGRQLANALRRGRAERRMCRRLGIEPIELSKGDIARIVELAESSSGALLEDLEAGPVNARVVEE